MKIVFLDINGVLNSLYSRSRAYDISTDKISLIENSFDENSMLLLKDLIEKTNSYIVISSSWRKNTEYYNVFLNVFKKYLPIERIIGTTRINGNIPRITEISDYLNSSKYSIDNYVIFDDLNQMNGLIEHFILVDSKYGLTSENCQKAIEILN